MEQHCFGTPQKLASRSEPAHTEFAVFSCRQGKARIKAAQIQEAPPIGGKVVRSKKEPFGSELSKPAANGLDQQLIGDGAKVSGAPVPCPAGDQTTRRSLQRYLKLLKPLWRR